MHESRRPALLRRWLCLAAIAAAPAALAQPAAPEPLPLFAVEITVGPKWDPSKAPQDQLHFREHSVNLKRLRDAGSLVLGARYGDKGLVVLAAADETSARAMLDDDPSIQAGVFRYRLDAFNVFYPGGVAALPRKSAPP